MTIDINQFWNLFTESRLASPGQIQTLFSECDTQSSASKSPESLAKWIVNRGALSSYQAEILLAGHHGPFKYGRYAVIDKMSDGPLAGCFSARDQKTGYGVILKFVPGKSVDDLELWNRVESRCGKISAAADSAMLSTSPSLLSFLNPVFETVVLPSHRFVVIAVPSGKSVDRLPRKSRLPWLQACAVMAQAAKGLQAVHERGLLHGGISESSIWTLPGGEVRLLVDPIAAECGFANQYKSVQFGQLACLAPEVAVPASPKEKLPLTPAAEVYSLGCVLVRLLTGRSYCSESETAAIKSFHQNSANPSFEKYDLSGDLEKLVVTMLDKNPANRPSSSEVANLLALYSGQTAELEAVAIDPARSAYEATLDRVGLDADSAGPAIDIHAGELVDKSNEAGAADRIKTARENAEKRKKQKWLMPIVVLGALLGFIVLLSAGAYMSSGVKVAEDAGASDVASGTSDPDRLSDGQNGVNANAGGNTSSHQTLVADDDELLWETPTTGVPIAFDHLPTSPKLLLQVRLADLLKKDEGGRLLKSFGPEFDGAIQAFQNRSGIELGKVSELLLSFHDSGEQGFEVFAVVTLVEPLPETRLMTLWRQPGQAATEGSGVQFLQSADGTNAFFITQRATAGEESSTSGVRQFAMGPPELVQDALEIAGGVPLAGSLRTVAAWTDRDRHVNFLFLRPSLFNDRGQQWMGDSLAGFNRELSVMIPDGVPGGLIGFHMDQANYIELRFDRIADLKAGELKTMMQRDLRDRRDQLINYVARIQPNAFWDRVRVKYAGMLADVSRNFRWGVEHGEVVGNCWLPSMAAHNLIGASELVSSFAAGSGAVDTNSVSQLPQTLDELLSAKRDLEISNPPDLNVLMAELKSEIDSDYGGLPFTWDIKLLGGDLEKDGITKNQRPGELVMKQKTLAEILTSIMISANPSKDITGASDPECKLIWVVAADPDKPDQKSILVTTRAAAAEKSYTLPAAFRETE